MKRRGVKTRKMFACTRCNRWHMDAENAAGKRLTCTEVKQFWNNIKLKHQSLFGHLPMLTKDDRDCWICLRCKQQVMSEVK